MENIYITWKSFIVPDNANPRYIYPRFSYQVVEVVNTTIGITLSYGQGEPVVIGYVPAGQRAVFRLEDGLDEIVVTPEYHQNLVDTDQDRVVGYTTLRLSNENWQYQTAREPLWSTMKAGSLSLSNARTAIHGPGTSREVNAPVGYQIPVVRDPETLMLSPANSAVEDTSVYTGEYQGVGIYGIDKDSNPSIPRLRRVRVGVNGEIKVGIVDTPNLPVNIVAYNAELSPGRTNYHIRKPLYYTGVVRSVTVGSRYIPLVVTAGGTVNLASIQAGAKSLAIESVILYLRSATVTMDVAVSLRRFTGAVTGGTVLTLAPLYLEGGNASAVITQQPSSVAGVISTPRHEIVQQITTTVGSTELELCRAPLILDPSVTYGYVVVIETSAAGTLNVFSEIIISEV